MKGIVLYNLLRPEAVRESPLPLSSDAFTYFGRMNAQQYNAVCAVILC